MHRKNLANPEIRLEISVAMNLCCVFGGCVRGMQRNFELPISAFYQSVKNIENTFKNAIKLWLDIVDVRFKGALTFYYQ